MPSDGEHALKQGYREAIANAELTNADREAIEAAEIPVEHRCSLDDDAD